MDVNSVNIACQQRKTADAKNFVKLYIRGDNTQITKEAVIEINVF